MRLAHHFAPAFLVVSLLSATPVVNGQQLQDDKSVPDRVIIYKTVGDVD